MREPLKFFIIAGEPSGDLHGANLIRAIKKLNNYSSFMGHGGFLMEEEGMRIIEHCNNLSVMGFKEVIKQLPKFLKIMNSTIELVEKSKPDRIILIDYPGFNLRFAKRVSYLKIPITYFILPQAWAWKSKRVEIIKKYVNQSFSIFPFEKDWYNLKGLKTKFFGHPFIENQHVDENRMQFFKRHNLNHKNRILVLLPGSRQQEIDKHWPIFVKTVVLLKKEYPLLQIIVAKSNNVKIPISDPTFKIEKNSKKAIIAADVAIVASGTATLECAVENTPMVVCYKFSLFNWIIARYLVKVKYSSIVNLIGEKRIVPELLQSKMTPENIKTNLIKLIEEKSDTRTKMQKELNQVKSKLGSPGVYNKIAEEILKETKQ